MRVLALPVGVTQGNTTFLSLAPHGGCELARRLRPAVEIDSKGHNGSWKRIVRETPPLADRTKIRGLSSVVLGQALSFSGAPRCRR